MALTLARFSKKCRKFNSFFLLNQASDKKARLSNCIICRNYSSVAPQIDKFIPLSSRHIFKQLIQENEKTKNTYDFENFSRFVETTISKQNHNVFPELKFLYSPFDPDLSTPSNLTSHELSDRNFWFMQHLSNLLTSSGFEQIQELEKPIKGGIFGQGVVVECNTDKYDVFQIWVMGGQKDLEAPSDTPNTTASFPDSLFKRPMLWRRPKRAVVVKREKGSGKVDVRLFKSVSHPSLLLPPPDALKMHPTYKNIFATSTALTVFFLLSRPSLIYFLGTDHLGRTPLTLAGFFGGVSVLMWGLFKQLQKSHMDAVVDVLYEGVVCRNLNCIETLVQRAQEELLKGVLLAYHFLTLSSQGVSKEDLEAKVEEWVKSEMGGVVVKINLEDTLKWMKDQSLIEENNNNITLTDHQHHSTHHSHLFHNSLSDVITPTPFTTTIIQQARKMKAKA